MTDALPTTHDDPFPRNRYKEIVITEYTCLERLLLEVIVHWPFLA